MTKTPTREQLIQKGKRLRRIAVMTHRVQSFLTGFKRKARHQEIWIDTGLGRVRALCYGLEDPQPAPVLFDLHGGGFLLGSPEMDEALNRTFRDRVGCKVISINYPKAPEFPYPAAVNQIYAVVSHVYQNAEQYGVDRERMAIGGHSAGGNLSTVTCMKARQEGRFQFVCQVLDYPPLDLATSPFDKPQPEGCIPPNVAAMFDACYVDPAQARDPYVSPVYARPQDLEGLPPALLILAGRDSLHDEGSRYGEMLQAAGVAVECCEYPDAAHGFTLQPSADAADALEKMVAFLRQYLYRQTG